MGVGAICEAILLSPPCVSHVSLFLYFLVYQYLGEEGLADHQDGDPPKANQCLDLERILLHSAFTGGHCFRIQLHPRPRSHTLDHKPAALITPGPGTSPLAIAPKSYIQESVKVQS